MPLGIRARNWTIILLSIIVFRSGRLVKNSILTKDDFPAGYYANGSFTAQCTTLGGDSTVGTTDLKYCEDATFWDLLDSGGNFEERHVLFSCDPGRKSWNTVMGPLRNPHPHGGLWVYSPQAGNSDANIQAKVNGPTKLQRVTLGGYPEGHDFHPLGMEIYPSYAGNASSLFVINHARHRTVIEQFTLSPSTPTIATWIRTLTSPYFISPNSIALTSPTSFYVSNDHLLTRRLPFVGHVFPLLETVLSLPLGWLSHISFEPNTTTPSAPPTIHHTFSALGIPFVNGVSLSHDGTQVAIAASSLNQIYFYSRSPSNNTLKHTHSVPVPFSPDNIMFDEHGVLIVTGHPHFPSLIGVAANKTDAVAPSWVISIEPRARGVDGEVLTTLPVEYDLRAPISASKKVPAVPSHEIETLFQSNGTGFSSSSTGLRDSTTGNLYITGLYAEAGVMVCRR